MEKITISGKTYPCRVTMGAMLRFKHETGHDVSRMQQDDVSDLVIFLYCCTASACKADGVEFEYSAESFADQLTPDMLSEFYSGMKTTEKKTAKR